MTKSSSAIVTTNDTTSSEPHHHPIIHQPTSRLPVAISMTSFPTNPKPKLILIKSTLPNQSSPLTLSKSISNLDPSLTIAQLCRTIVEETSPELFLVPLCSDGSKKIKLLYGANYETMIRIVNPPKTNHGHHDGNQNEAVEKHVSFSFENGTLIEPNDLIFEQFLDEKTNLVLKLDGPRWSSLSSRSLSVDEKRKRRSMKLTLKSGGGGIRDIRISERDEEEEVKEKEEEETEGGESEKEEEASEKEDEKSEDYTDDDEKESDEEEGKKGKMKKDETKPVKASDDEDEEVDGETEGMNKEQLKQFCRMMGLTVSGNKSDLMNRLRGLKTSTKNHSPSKDKMKEDKQHSHSKDSVEMKTPIKKEKRSSSIGTATTNTTKNHPDEKKMKEDEQHSHSKDDKSVEMKTPVKNRKRSSSIGMATTVTTKNLSSKKKSRKVNEKKK